MDFKYEVKALLNETIAKKILTTKTGEKIERTAGQKEREVHKNAVDKLMQAAKDVGSGEYDIQATWLQEGDDDKSIADFITHPKKLMIGNTQAIDIIRGRLPDAKDKKKFDEIVKWAKNGGEEAMADLIKVAKGMLADSAADKKALAAGDKEVRKEIIDKGIENLEIIYNASLQRNRLGKDAGKAQVVELQTDKSLGEVKLSDLIKKDKDGKFVPSNERLINKVLTLLNIPKKDFLKDLEEYNKVVGKTWVKDKRVETRAGDITDTKFEDLKLRADDLAKDFEGKYIDAIYRKYEKYGKKISKTVGDQLKALRNMGLTAQADDLERKGKRAEAKDVGAKLKKALEGNL